MRLLGSEDESFENFADRQYLLIYSVLFLYGTRFSYNDVNPSTTLNPSSTEQQVKDPLMQHQIFTEFNSQCAKILQTPTDQRWAH